MAVNPLQADFVKQCRDILGKRRTGRKRRDIIIVELNPRNGRYQVSIRDKRLAKRLERRGYYYYTMDYESEEQARAEIRSACE